MAIETTDKGVRITLECDGNDSPIPSARGVGELVFITQLARLGTIVLIFKACSKKSYRSS